MFSRIPIARFILARARFAVFALLVGLAIPIAQSPMARAESGERWTHKCKVDEMTDEKWCVAASPRVSGNPYRSSSLVVKCWDSGSVDVYAWSDYLNLTEGELEQWASGEVVRKLPMLVRFDSEKARHANFYVDDSFSSWANNRWGAMRKIATHNSVKIQYPFYRDGNVVITYNLAGANDAIRASLTGCGIGTTRLNDSIKKAAARYEPQQPLYVSCRKSGEQNRCEVSYPKESPWAGNLLLSCYSHTGNEKADVSLYGDRSKVRDSFYIPDGAEAGTPPKHFALAEAIRRCESGELGEPALYGPSGLE